jgi:hypothetical protein
MVNICIEAAAMGVPTFTLGLSPYSIASNIMNITPNNLDDLLNLRAKNADDEDVFLTIYQMHNFGHEISEYSRSSFIRTNSELEILNTARLKPVEKFLYYSKKVIVRMAKYFPTPFGYFSTPSAIDNYLGLLNENFRRKIKTRYLNFLMTRTIDHSKFQI